MLLGHLSPLSAAGFSADMALQLTIAAADGASCAEFH
jgi:hypothetical protein